MVTWFSEEYFLTAIAQWLACVIYISNQPKRWKKWKAAILSAGMLFLQAAAFWLTTHDRRLMIHDTLLLQLLRACLFLFLMIIHLFMICKISPATACVLGMFAYLAAELAIGVTMFMHYLIIRNAGTLTLFYRWGTVFVVFLVVFGILFFVERRFFIRAGQYHACLKDLVITGVITLLCFLLSNLVTVFRANNWTELWNNTLGNIPRWMFVLVGLFVLYGRRIWSGYLQMRHDLEMINGVFEKQKNQYEQAMINAEAINQQYHDLKNQIAIMKAEIPAEQQAQWLGQLEKKVQQMEPERLTGNPVLDTILWEKTQICIVHDIKLSYVLDGSLFANIAIDDLCVIFGGALDNAIEAVMKIDDPERRLIHLKAMEQQGFIAICAENINDTPLSYKDGIPVTTKEDKQHHGYGVKGIRYIAEKYGGSAAAVQDGCWFRLTVLLKKTEH